MTGLERWIIAGLSVLTLAFLGSLAITSSYWFELRSLHIADSMAGGDPIISYDREFHRDFTGEWLVAIWAIEKGVAQAKCSASGQWPYKAGHPEFGRTLGWLTAGECLPLAPGQYRAEVILTANAGSILARSQALESNVFEVRP